MAIADTGFLVAFANSRDVHHEWAVSVAWRVSPPCLTCEAVLAETAFHLTSVALVLAMIDDGFIRVAFDAASHLDRLAELASKYGDQSPDLADLCLVRMSELFPRHSVVTVDRTDFGVYRRNKRDVIPIVCPTYRG